MHSRLLGFHSVSRCFALRLLQAFFLAALLPGGATAAAIVPPGSVWICWNQQLPGLCHQNLMSVKMLSATDGWIVGERGLALHWDGTSWQPASVNTDETLTAVDGTGPTNVWATSLGGPWSMSGHLLRWDGKAWTAMASSAGMRTVKVLAAAEVWAGGGCTYIACAGPPILHWLNGALVPVRTPGLASGVQVVSIDVLPSGLGWALGAQEPLRWDGNAWNYVADATGVTSFDVDIVSPSDSWAVGMVNAGTSPGGLPIYVGAAEHWNGATWTLLPSTGPAILRAVDMLNAHDGWAVGDGGAILHWNGQAWSSVPSPTDASLSSVSMISSTDGWAVGSGGAILRWDGAGWHMVTNAPSYTLRGVDALSTTQALAVGTRGTISHWNGSSWLQETSPTTNTLNAVSMVTDSEAWAVGDAGTILHWNGQYWARYPIAEGAALTSISMVSRSDGWIAGRGFLHWDGNAWTREALPGSDNVVSVAMNSTNSGWAVDTMGQFWQYTAGAWQVVHVVHEAGLDLVAVAAHPQGVVWGVGAFGPFYPADSYHSAACHFDGTTWSDCYPNFSGDPVYAVDIVAPDDVWMTGLFGLLVHWDGAAFAETPKLTSANLYSVDMLSSGDGWAVGEAGTLLRRATLTSGLSLPVVIRR